VPSDYGFQEWSEDGDNARTVRLSELFDDDKDNPPPLQLHVHCRTDRRPLEVACPHCTSIIDAVDGQVPHVGQLMNVAIAAKVPIEQFRAHAATRGWRNIRLLSAANTTYNDDYHTEAADGSQRPIATIFVRRDGRTHHFWSSELFFAPTEPGLHPPTRRLHVAAVEHPRPDTRRSRERLGTTARILIDPD